MANAPVGTERKWLPPLAAFGVVLLCALLGYLFQSVTVFLAMITAWIFVSVGLIIAGTVMMIRHERRWNEQSSPLDYVACRFDDFISLRDEVGKPDVEITVVLQNGRRFAVPSGSFPTQVDVIKYEVRVHKGRPEYRNIKAVSIPSATL